MPLAPKRRGVRFTRTVPRERDTEKKANKFAKARGWIVRKVKWIGHSGAPDRLYIRKGVYVFIEWKKLGEGPTDTQKIEHAALRAAGAIVFVIDRYDEEILSFIFD